MGRKRTKIKDVKMVVSKPKKKVNISKNKELCEKFTKGACLRPDIFLKNRDCDDCHYNKYCIAPNKKFSWQKNKKKRH